MGNKQVQVSGILIDYVYIKGALMAEFSINATHENTNFLDHYVTRSFSLEIFDTNSSFRVK